MGCYAPTNAHGEVPVALTRFVTGVHTIRCVGDHLQITFYCNEISESGGVTRRVYNQPHEMLTMPCSTMPDAIGKALAAIGPALVFGPPGTPIVQ